MEYGTFFGPSASIGEIFRDFVEIGLLIATTPASARRQVFKRSAPSVCLILHKLMIVIAQNDPGA
jgi:hypothetical protein